MVSNQSMARAQSMYDISGPFFLSPFIIPHFSEKIKFPAQTKKEHRRSGVP